MRLTPLLFSATLRSWTIPGNLGAATTRPGVKMRVVLLHYSAPPTVGGVESVLAHQAQHMLRAGHAVSLVVGRGEAWDDRIPVRVLPLLDSRAAAILDAKANLDRGVVPPSFASLVETLHHELLGALAEADVVVAHNVASLHLNLALTAALHRFAGSGSKPRLILWHHDLAWTSRRYQSELHSGWPWDLLRQPWPGVRHAVVSRPRLEELASLMNLPRDSILVIPAGLDEARFLGLGTEAVSLAERLGLFGADPLLLMPVRLIPRKNIELGLRTLAELRREQLAAMMVVTGPPGPHDTKNEAYLAHLHQQIDDLALEGSAHLLADAFPEGLSDAAVADLYRLSDGLLLASTDEGFGIPILEAGLLRMPIFCTEIPSLRALAGDAAVYFSPDAPPREVAALIAKRLGSSPLCQMRSRIRREYTWDAVYNRCIAPLLEDPQ